MESNINLPTINLSDILQSSTPSNQKFDKFLEKLKYGKADTKNNGWSVNKENRIKTWIEENQIYSWLLSKASGYFNKQNKWIMIPLIILSAITTISTIGSSGILKENALKIFVLVIGVVNAGVLILALLKQLLDPGQISNQFSNISKNIQL